MQQQEQIRERLLTFLENPQPSGNPSIEAREEQKVDIALDLVDYFFGNL